MKKLLTVLAVLAIATAPAYAAPPTTEQKADFLAT